MFAFFLGVLQYNKCRLLKRSSFKRVSKKRLTFSAEEVNLFSHYGDV